MDEFDEDVYDDFDDDLDEDYDGYDDEDFDEDDFGEDDEEAGGGSGLDAFEIEQAGIFDGENDSVDCGGVLYGSYGMSVDLDEMDDDERELYEQGYMSGAQGY